MILKDLEKYNQIVIQVHDSPDADAIGSGYAIYKYFKSKGKDVRLVYGGKFLISKSNMKLLISQLDIPVEYVTQLDNPELLITVDCQYGQGNVKHFEAQNVAMIDHHSTGKESDGMAEIRNHLVSCATVCYALLKEAGYDVNADISVATALYYGLYMDSNQLSEISHPFDRDMVDFLKYDKSLVTRLRYANFNLAELQVAGVAILNREYDEKNHYAILKAEPCDPNILGLIGDIVIQVDAIDVSLVYNQCEGGYKLSIRSCSLEVAANELMHFITMKIGNGGGHIDKAGGFISETKFANAYPNETIEYYLTKKMNEYYEGYDVIYSGTGIEDRDKFKRYQKQKLVVGFVKMSDLFENGTECKIRTLEGDVIVKSSKDIYLMIGYNGEVYPLEREVFEQRYTEISGKYDKEFEYAPSIINLEENKPYDLMGYAKPCMAMDNTIVLARPAKKYTKVFTIWEYETYMAADAGDMICYREADERDVYVVKKDIFEKTYKEI
ncbi:MAG: DHH family phosphoesterase [Lachnospiraceae bacterium]|nr:DHH family phosphoesterase [Lachnospiraceae bacterium]